MRRLALFASLAIAFGRALVVGAAVGLAVLGAVALLGGCGGSVPPVCSAYDATRATVCGACAAMPAECPFRPRGAP